MSNGSRPAGTLERLAQEVFERVSRDQDDAGLDDPRAYLERHIAEVQDAWQAAGLSRVELDACLQGPDEHALRESIRAALEALPERQREALLLHANERLTPAEIARNTRWTEPAVLQDLVQAYVRLAALLRSRFPSLDL